MQLGGTTWWRIPQLNHTPTQTLHPNQSPVNTYCKGGNTGGEGVDPDVEEGTEEGHEEGDEPEDQQPEDEPQGIGHRDEWCCLFRYDSSCAIR